MFRRNPDRPARTPRPGWALLWFAAILLLLLAGAQGYVSWAAQYGFIFAAKHAHLPSVLEALGLDTGAVIFAVLGLAHARMGHSAVIERTLNLACAMGSMTMNLLSANLGSPRSVAVYVLPAVLYVGCSDRLIATAAHASGVRETSMWRWVGVLSLYSLRTVVAFPSTVLGLRRRLLELTPLPEKRAPVLALSSGQPGVISSVFGSEPGSAPEDSGTDESTVSTPRKPLPEVLADAETEFATELAGGTVPGIREIRRRLLVGQSRAVKVQEHLGTLLEPDDVPVEDTPAPAGFNTPDPDTVIFQALGRDRAPGQSVSAYQHLPVTPQGR